MRKTRLVILPGVRSITQIGCLLLFLACPTIAFKGQERRDVDTICNLNELKNWWLPSDGEEKGSSTLLNGYTRQCIGDGLMQSQGNNDSAVLNSTPVNPSLPIIKQYDFPEERVLRLCKVWRFNESHKMMNMNTRKQLNRGVFWKIPNQQQPFKNAQLRIENEFRFCTRNTFSTQPYYYQGSTLQDNRRQKQKLVLNDQRHLKHQLGRLTIVSLKGRTQERRDIRRSIIKEQRHSDYELEHSKNGHHKIDSLKERKSDRRSDRLDISRSDRHKTDFLQEQGQDRRTDISDSDGRRLLQRVLYHSKSDRSKTDSSERRVLEKRDVRRSVFKEQRRFILDGTQERRVDKRSAFKRQDHSKRRVSQLRRDNFRTDTLMDRVAERREDRRAVLNERDLNLQLDMSRSNLNNFYSTRFMKRNDRSITDGPRYPRQRDYFRRNWENTESAKDRFQEGRTDKPILNTSDRFKSDSFEISVQERRTDRIPLFNVYLPLERQVDLSRSDLYKIDSLPNRIQERRADRSTSDRQRQRDNRLRAVSFKDRVQERRTDCSTSDVRPQLEYSRCDHLKLNFFKDEGHERRTDKRAIFNVHVYSDNFRNRHHIDSIRERNLERRSDRSIFDRQRQLERHEYSRSGRFKSDSFLDRVQEKRTDRKSLFNLHLHSEGLMDNSRIGRYNTESISERILESGTDRFLPDGHRHSERQLNHMRSDRLKAASIENRVQERMADRFISEGRHLERQFKNSRNERIKSDFFRIIGQERRVARISTFNLNLQSERQIDISSIDCQKPDSTLQRNLHKRSVVYTREGQRLSGREMNYSRRDRLNSDYFRDRVQERRADRRSLFNVRLHSDHQLDNARSDRYKADSLIDQTQEITVDKRSVFNGRRNSERQLEHVRTERFKSVSFRERVKERKTEQRTLINGQQRLDRQVDNSRSGRYTSDVLHHRVWDSSTSDELSHLERQLGYLRIDRLIKNWVQERRYDRSVGDENRHSGRQLAYSRNRRDAVKTDFLLSIQVKRTDTRSLFNRQRDSERQLDQTTKDHLKSRDHGRITERFISDRQHRLARHLGQSRSDSYKSDSFDEHQPRRVDKRSDLNEQRQSVRSNSRFKNLRDKSEEMVTSSGLFLNGRQLDSFERQLNSFERQLNSFERQLDSSRNDRDKDGSLSNRIKVSMIDRRSIVNGDRGNRAQFESRKLLALETISKASLEGKTTEQRKEISRRKFRNDERTTPRSWESHRLDYLINNSRLVLEKMVLSNVISRRRDSNREMYHRESRRNTLVSSNSLEREMNSRNVLGKTGRVTDMNKNSQERREERITRNTNRQSDSIQRNIRNNYSTRRILSIYEEMPAFETRGFFNRNLHSTHLILLQFRYILGQQSNKKDVSNYHQELLQKVGVIEGTDDRINKETEPYLSPSEHTSRRRNNRSVFHIPSHQDERQAGYDIRTKAIDVPNRRWRLPSKNVQIRNSIQTEVTMANSRRKQIVHSGSKDDSSRDLHRLESNKSQWIRERIDFHDQFQVNQRVKNNARQSGLSKRFQNVPHLRRASTVYYQSQDWSNTFRDRVNHSTKKFNANMKDSDSHRIDVREYGKAQNLVRSEIGSQRSLAMEFWNNRNQIYQAVTINAILRYPLDKISSLENWAVHHVFDVIKKWTEDNLDKVDYSSMHFENIQEIFMGVAVATIMILMNTSWNKQRDINFNLLNCRRIFL